MGEISGALPKSPLLNFDVNVQEFLKNVLEVKNQKVMCSRKQFWEALRKAKSTECPETSNSCYDDSLHRKAYLFRFSPCYTSAVANHFLGLVIKNPMILKDAIRRRRVHICCLGGGPGTEVVALRKVLSLVQDTSEQTTKQPLRVIVTIVDKNVEWKETAFEVLQTLTHSDDIFNQSQIDIKLRFLVADLTEPLNENVEKSLQKADIVTMVTFLSTLGEKFPINASSLTQNVAERMKPNGVLFYLDTGKTKQCRTIQKSLNIVKDIECVYGPIELEAFTLSLLSLQRNVKLFWKMFHENICLTSTIINSCAWIKSEHHKIHQISSKNSKAVLPNFKKWKAEWEEKALQSQEKLNVFHNKVKTILPSRQRSSALHFNPLQAVGIIFLFANKSKDRRCFTSRKKKKQRLNDDLPSRQRSSALHINPLPASRNIILFANKSKDRRYFTSRKNKPRLNDDLSVFWMDETLEMNF